MIMNMIGTDQMRKRGSEDERNGRLVMIWKMRIWNLLLERDQVRNAELSMTMKRRKKREKAVAREREREMFRINFER